MVPTGEAAKPGADAKQAEGQLLAVDTEAKTRPILEAINASKYELMGRIHHLSSECTLIRHDLDKIRGRLIIVEARVSAV